MGNCITCDRKLVVCWWDHETEKWRWNKASNLGHFVGRGAKSLRYDEENCNLQCAHCNAWRDKVSMLDAYKEALDLKYGHGTWKKLVKLGKEMHKPTRDELNQIIADSKEYVSWTLAHPTGV